MCDGWSSTWAETKKLSYDTVSVRDHTIVKTPHIKIGIKQMKKSRQKLALIIVILF